MIQTIIGCAIGLVVSIVVADVYYRKSGKDLKYNVEKLKKEVENLNKILCKLENLENIQIERNYKIDKGEEAKIIKENNNYGINTSDSKAGSINIKNNGENTSVV